MALESRSLLEPGDAAPDFELPGADGESYTLGSFADADALLLVITCNHCPYAKAKVAELNRLAAEFDGLAVVGVNPNDETQYPTDSFEHMRELVADGTIRWDGYLRDEDQQVAAAYGATCTPDPFLFDNDDGTFRLAYHGRLDDAPNPNEEPSEREMANLVETLLAGGTIDAPMRPARGCSIKWREGNEPEYWN